MWLTSENKPVGSRLTETRNGVTDTYNYPATSNRLSSITRAQGNRDFAYDNAGNPTARTAEDGSSQTLSFNNANRLDSISISGNLAATYTYNPLGQRVVKALANGSKEIYHYDEAGQLLAVMDGTGNTLREYIYRDNQQVAMVANGNIYYIHSDHLNTPQVITDANQQVVWIANYEPFGKLAANQANSIEVYSRFPGQYLDSETGLYYNYFRDYDPSIGRYIESDPIGLGGGINTYAYVEGNPTHYSDPYGLEKWNWDGWGNTSICSYYEQMAEASGCKYYQEAAKICKGENAGVNTVLSLGIAQAWASNSTNASQSEIATQIRTELVIHDQNVRALNGRDSVVPRGDLIDMYHQEAFQSAGISSFWYGGNLWPQGVWPNVVPYDPIGNSAFDPRNYFLPSGDTCGCAQ